MKAVKQLAMMLSLGALSAVAASAASREEAYLRAFSKGPGVPEPIKVVAPAVKDAPPGAQAMIAFVVDIAGVPQGISVESSNDEALAAAAVEAVKQWRFTPVVREGTTVETRVVLPVRVMEEPLLRSMRFASN